MKGWVSGLSGLSAALGASAKGLNDGVHEGAHESGRMHQQRVELVGDRVLLALDARGKLVAVDLKDPSIVRECSLAQPLDFQPDALCVSPGGGLLLLYNRLRIALVQWDTTRFLGASFAHSQKRSNNRTAHVQQPPTIVLKSCTLAETILGKQDVQIREITQVSWHPMSDGHVMLLTADARFWIIDVSKSTIHEEQSFRVGLGEGSACPTGFVTGAYGRGWDTFSVYFTDHARNLYVLCPVAPYGMTVPKHLVVSLVLDAKEHMQDAAPEHHARVLEKPPHPEPHVRRLSFEGAGAAASSSFRPAAVSDTSRPADASSRSQQEHLQWQWLSETFGQEVVDFAEHLVDDASHIVVCRAFGLNQCRPCPQGPCRIVSNHNEATVPREEQSQITSQQAQATARSSCGPRSLTLLEYPPGPPVLFESHQTSTQVRLLVCPETPRPHWHADFDDEIHVGIETDYAPELILFETIAAPAQGAQIECPSSLVKALGVAFLRSNAGVCVLNMDWLAPLARDDASQLLQSPPSQIHPLLLADPTNPIRGVTFGCLQNEFFALYLSQDWRVGVESLRGAFLSSQVGIIDKANPAISTAQSRDMEGTMQSSDTRAGSASAFEARVRQHFAEIEAIPRLLFGRGSGTHALSKKQTVSAVFGYVQLLLEQVQNAHAKPFWEMHTMLEERSAYLVDVEKRQLEAIAQVRAHVEDVEIGLERSSMAIERLQIKRRALDVRLVQVAERVRRLRGSPETADADFAATIRDKKGSVDALRQRIEQVSMAVKSQASEQKRRADLTPQRSERRTLEMRWDDQRRLHKAMVEHSETLAALHEQSTSLAARLDRVSLQTALK
ncbi:Nuclear pore complex protein NUP88 [Porphyridium purpureum]|uniref:Nuclear pore complex protein NUP88 n=1 Tax=Porphyridium purpureum TaxID=35688 RepID=A0A5J4YLS3_PORPP|nr:Nuclear pore complex protein NUP88 [Porphyridium purpureum]|eukprot:POR8392..scf249_10